MPLGCVLYIVWEIKFHTHKTTGKIIVLYFLIFTFLEDDSDSLLGYGAVLSHISRLMFYGCVLLPLSGCDGGSTHLWNISLLLQDYIAPLPRRLIFILAALRTRNLSYILRWQTVKQNILVYSKAEMVINSGDRESPCFRPVWPARGCITEMFTYTDFTIHFIKHIIININRYTEFSENFV
jgi:hypothetical protein